MRLRLVYPRPATTNDSVYSPSPILEAFFRLANSLAGDGLYTSGKRRFLIPPLNLTLLAAIAQHTADVDIVDERATPLDFDEPVDVVGITCSTSEAVRAYAIADRYRERGIPTILGGIHPTVAPDEAISHADSVVVGEAELVFPRLLQDLKEGALQRFYQAQALHSLVDLPLPRRDLLDSRDYLTTNVIQTARGCPHACAFCSVSLTAGRHLRTRPLHDILTEMDGMEGRFFAFLDDNIVGSLQHARTLLEALRGRGLHWFGNATAYFAEDERMVDTVAASGCRILLIGFESLSESSLLGVHKRFNRPDRFIELVRRIRSRGIGVIGCFILGLDGDADEGARIVRFAQDAELDFVQVGILTPYPGTALYDEFRQSGRLLTTDWSYFDTTLGNVVFRPESLSPLALQDMYFETNRRLFSLGSILRRLYRGSPYPTFFIPYNLRQRRKLRTARKHRRVPLLSM